jgi:hypothetical protein
LTLLFDLVVAFIVAPQGTSFGNVQYDALQTYAYAIIFYSSVAALSLTFIVHI